MGERGGYFDDYGIIRDVMQNHLLQILALLAMERPVDLCAAAVRDAKVAVLKRVQPIEPANLVVGQYGASASGMRRAYRAEPGVPAESRTPTYAAAVLHLDAPRWAGVPFFIEAGKALEGRVNEVRIRFREVPGGTFCGTGPALPPNELVIRI